MKPTVVVTNWVHDAVLDRLGQRFDVLANRQKEPWPADILQANLQRADAALVFMPDHIGPAVLQRAPRLRMISCCLKGYDNFDIEACSQRGVLVAILPDLLTEPGAELAVGLMLAAGRHVLSADAYVRRGEFRGWRPLFYGKGLAQSTVGIVGLGSIGRSIAQRLGGFGSRLLYWDRHRLDPAGEQALAVSYVDLDPLLSQADFVVLAVGLAPETRHLIDDERLSRMKSEATLVNIARGSLVDEAAVARALAAGRLGFYAADVFEFEDWALPDRPQSIDPALLAQADRTLFTPHLGSAVRRVREEMAMQAAENIISYFRGDIPEGALNADRIAKLSPRAHGPRP